DDPRVAAVPAGAVDRLGIVGRIAQDQDTGPVRQRQLADQVGRRLRRGAVLQALGPAMRPGVIRLAEGDPDARGRDEQPHGEAVAVLRRALGLAVAAPLAGPAPTVAGAEGILGLRAGPADRGRV